jgi:hypothetical protein
MMERLITFLAASALVALSTGIVFAHDAETRLAAADAKAGSLEGLPSVASLPAGVVQVSPIVPGMGEHWANPKNLPFGPIYCVIEGKVTCMEYMISQADSKPASHGPSSTPGLKARRSRRSTTWNSTSSRTAMRATKSRTTTCICISSLPRSVRPAPKSSAEPVSTG